MRKIPQSDGRSVGGTEHPQDLLDGTVEILGDVLAPAVPPSAWNASRGVLLSQEHGSKRKPRRP